jgi:hypothetical protein
LSEVSAKKAGKPRRNRSAMQQHEAVQFDFNSLLEFFIDRRKSRRSACRSSVKLRIGAWTVVSIELRASSSHQLQRLHDDPTLHHLDHLDLGPSENSIIYKINAKLLLAVHAAQSTLVVKNKLSSTERPPSYQQNDLPVTHRSIFYPPY